MKTAIIGLGNIGSRLAKNLTAGGQNIIVSERNLPKAEALAAELGGKAQTMSIEDAVGKADVIILAIYFQAIKEFVEQHRRALAGKIIVDPSNPIAPDGKGGFKKNHSR
jgi:8-hydroxy-5-deazaflavin:NADPH oxidoreductase